MAGGIPLTAEFQIQSDLSLEHIPPASPKAYANQKFRLIFASDILYETANYDDLLTIFSKSLEKDGICYIFTKMYYLGNTGSVHAFMQSVELGKRFHCEIVYQFEEKVGGNVRAVLKLTRLF